ncbi:MAG TPA: EscU/YscU/HrcU family type III secretion system export apparatus switch protein [Kofleriaceae bacterium]|nr:EscU/YscU/HrcU family type III secretion system export apparatus switch protein [Kofleriaceae bacterium]
MERSLPPSARRLELARRAGVVLTSPAVVAAVALAVGVAAAVAAIGVVGASVASFARDGWSHAAERAPVSRALDVDGARLVGRAAGLATPVVLAACGAALLATAVIARGVVVPRRRIRGAPPAADDAGARATDALVALVRVAAMAAVAVGFLVDRLPAIAAVAGGTSADVPLRLRDLAVGLVARVAVAAVAASVLELAVRAARRRGALRMTVREARDEQRETAGDPHLRRRQGDASRADVRARIADAVVLLVGDDRAVAIGWQPGRDPRVLARGAGVTARALRAAARARRVPLAFAPALAGSLDATGPVTASDQPALASLLAALSIGPR